MSFSLKDSKDPLSLRSRGRLFQILGPKDENDLSPKLDFVLFSTNLFESFCDLSPYRSCLYATTCLERYAGEIAVVHLKTRHAALKIKRFSMGSQWSSWRRGDALSNFGFLKISLAAWFWNHCRGASEDLGRETRRELQ